MNQPINATTECLLVGEFVEQAEGVAEPNCCSAEASPTTMIAEYTDFGASPDEVKEFTVLLKDGRTIRVRGHGVKCDLSTGEFIGITLRNFQEEITVAIFNQAEILGIFHGELQSDRKIA